MVTWYLIAFVALWWAVGIYAAYRAFPAADERLTSVGQPEPASLTERKLAA